MLIFTFFLRLEFNSLISLGLGFPKNIVRSTLKKNWWSIRDGWLHVQMQSIILQVYGIM